MGPAKVGIVILHWKGHADTLDCLQSVATLEYASLETIVVDNEGTLSLAELRATGVEPLTLLSPPWNLGYTGGNNLGIRHALERGCDYVWLLNNDATVAPDTLSRLMAAARQNPQAGFLGPVVYTREAPEQVLSAGGMLDALGRMQHRDAGSMGGDRFDSVEAVDCLSGCALLVSRHAIESVGLLDEDFFAYHEDVEWCVRGRRAGYRVLLVPGARVWHPDTRARDEASAHVTYYITRNSLLYVRKQPLGWLTQLRLLGALARTLASWSLRPKWRSRRAQRNAMARAIGDFLLGRVGPMPGTPRTSPMHRTDPAIRRCRPTATG